MVKYLKYAHEYPEQLWSISNNFIFPVSFLHLFFEFSETPNSPSAAEKADLVLKVNPTQQD